MPRYSEEIKQQARELFAQGLSQREVGRQLGVYSSTIGYWVNPAVAERARTYSQEWRQANPDRKRESDRQRYQADRERQRENNRRWQQQNSERRRDLNRRWCQKNPERKREHRAFRRAAEQQATPPWLTKEHRKQMTALHAEARRLEKATGIPHHLDHIIPLHAKFNNVGEQIACGLHVPWNLRVLPGPENNAKWCKLPGPEDWTAHQPVL